MRENLKIFHKEELHYSHSLQNIRATKITADESNEMCKLRRDMRSWR